jgi:hypothetical protein
LVIGQYASQRIERGAVSDRHKSSFGHLSRSEFGVRYRDLFTAKGLTDGRYEYLAKFTPARSRIEGLQAIRVILFDHGVFDLYLRRDQAVEYDVSRDAGGAPTPTPGRLAIRKDGSGIEIENDHGLIDQRFEGGRKRV